MTSDIAVLSRPLPSGEGWAPACLAELHCSGTVETWPSEKRQPGSGSMQGTGQLGILPLDLAPKITPRAPRMKASPAHPVGGGLPSQGPSATVCSFPLKATDVVARLLPPARGGGTRQHKGALGRNTCQRPAAGPGVQGSAEGSPSQPRPFGGLYPLLFHHVLCPPPPPKKELPPLLPGNKG